MSEDRLFQPVLLLAGRHPGVRRPVASPSAPAAPAWSRPNGAGKSTLLKLVAGELTARRRHRHRATGVLGYLPAGPAADRRAARSPRCSAIAPVVARARRRSSPATPARSTSPPSATTGTSRNAPAPSSTGSASATSALDRRLGTLSGGQVVVARAGRAAAQAARTCCCSTSRPTTSTVDARQQALRRARRLARLPAGGQPRPGAARPDGPDRRARPAARSASTAATSPSTRRRSQAAREVGREERPQRRAGASSARSARCSRPGSGRRGAPAPRRATQQRRPARDLRRQR